MGCHMWTLEGDTMVVKDYAVSMSDDNYHISLCLSDFSVHSHTSSANFNHSALIKFHSPNTFRVFTNFTLAICYWLSKFLHYFGLLQCFDTVVWDTAKRSRAQVFLERHTLWKNEPAKLKTSVYVLAQHLCLAVYFSCCSRFPFNCDHIILEWQLLQNVFFLKEHFHISQNLCHISWWFDFTFCVYKLRVRLPAMCCCFSTESASQIKVILQISHYLFWCLWIVGINYFTVCSRSLYQVIINFIQWISSALQQSMLGTHYWGQVTQC